MFIIRNAINHRTEYGTARFTLCMNRALYQACTYNFENGKGEGVKRDKEQNGANDLNEFCGKRKIYVGDIVAKRARTKHATDTLNRSRDISARLLRA